MSPAASARRPAHRPPRLRAAPVAFSGRARGAAARPAAVAWLVLRSELVSFVRDRRALISAIVLPVVLYPLVFFANTWLERLSRETMAARKVTLAIDPAGAPFELIADLRRLLLQETPIELSELDAAELRQQAAAVPAGEAGARDVALRSARALLGSGRDLLITCGAHSVLAGRTSFQVWFDGAEDQGNEAHRRARKALSELERREAAARRERLLGAADPGRGLDAQSVDVATRAASGGAALGKLLPLVAVLVLVSGGAYGALSAFAGEREHHTLETLLVQPAPAASVAWGKFLAVLLLAIAALMSNTGSLVGSVALGLGRLPGMEAAGEGAAQGASGAGLGLEVARVFVGAVAFLPAAVLICALLCLISARTRSFREGQHAIFPLTLACGLPAAAAGWADVELDPLLALVPLFGQGLALRDAVGGKLELLPGAIAFFSGWAWGWLGLRNLARTLDAERIFSSEDTERELSLRGMQSRSALAWGFAAVLLIYFVGGWLQSWRLVPGLLITLWILAPALALCSARRTARRAGTGLAQVLSLRLPRPAHLLGAMLLAPALAWLMRAWVPLQQRLLPMPSTQLTPGGPLEVLEQLSPWALVAVFALTPAIHEELLFRGAIQGGLARELSWRRIVLWQALLFGLAHASVYRFVPTAAIGAVLALSVLRTGSLFPAMALHFLYDAILLLSERQPWLAEPQLSWLAVPGLALLWLPHRDGRPPGRA